MSQASVSPMRVRFHRLLHQMKQQMQRFRHAMFSWRTLISVIGIALAALLFAINITPVRYNISVGMVPTHTITATRDVVDEVTTESLRSAAEKAVQPTYVMKDGVLDSVLSNLNQIYAQFDAAIQYAETLEDYSSTRRYTADELAKAREIVTMIALKDYQMRTLLNTTRSDLSDLYSNLFDAIQNTMSGYIIEGSEHIAISNIMQIIGYRTDTNLLQNVVQPLLNEGARKEDIAASIFQSVVTQTISGLACGRPIRGHIAFLGGPLQYLSELRERFYLTLNLDEDHRIVPQNAHLFY